MYEVVGADTQKVYFKGTEAECHRYLNSKYPSKTDGTGNGSKGGKLITQLLPEIVKIERCSI